MRSPGPSRNPTPPPSILIHTQSTLIHTPAHTFKHPHPHHKHHCWLLGSPPVWTSLTAKDIFGPTQLEEMLAIAKTSATNKQMPNPTIVPAAGASSSTDDAFASRAEAGAAEESTGKKRSMAGWAKHKDRDTRRAEARREAQAKKGTGKKGTGKKGTGKKGDADKGDSR